MSKPVEELSTSHLTDYTSWLSPCSFTSGCLAEPQTWLCRSSPTLSIPCHSCTFCQSQLTRRPQFGIPIYPQVAQKRMFKKEGWLDEQTGLGWEKGKQGESGRWEGGKGRLLDLLLQLLSYSYNFSLLEITSKKKKHIKKIMRHSLTT